MIRDRVVLFFFFALFLFVCYQMLLIFSPFLKTAFWAVTLALILFPLHIQACKLIKTSPSLAALLSTSVVVLLTLPLGALLLFSMAQQGLELYDVARDYVSGGGVEKMIQWIRSYEPLRNLESQLLQSEDLQQKLSNLILNVSKSIGTFVTGLLAGLGKNLLGLIIHVILAIFFLFFIFRDGPRFYRYVYEIVPMEEKHKKAVFQKVNDTFSAVLRGQFLTALVQSVLAGLVFLFLGIPLALLFGFLTLLMAMVPIVGAGSIWIPLDIYLFATHQTGKGIVLLIFGALGISMVDNFLKPILIGQKAKLPTLFLFLGIIGGLKLYGVLGLFMGPVVLSVFFALVSIYQEEYKVTRA